MFYVLEKAKTNTKEKMFKFLDNLRLYIPGTTGCIYPMNNFSFSSVFFHTIYFTQ